MNNNYEMVSYFLGIGIGVIMAFRKTSVKDKAIHFSYHEDWGAYLRPYKDLLML